MHIELRVRTVCELVLNQSYYLQPHIVSILNSDGSAIVKNILPATSGCYKEACNDTTEDIALSYFKEDCREAT